MSELTVAEFIDELITDLEEQMEGTFTAGETWDLRALLTRAYGRIEREDR